MTNSGNIVNINDFIACSKIQKTSDVESVSMTFVTETFSNINLFTSIGVRLLWFANIVNVGISSVINFFDIDQFSTEIILKIQ